MNKLLYVLIAGLGLVTTAGAQAVGDPVKLVLALEARWLQADKTNNPALAEPLLADDYVSTGADGELSGKAETLADARARRYTGAVMEDIKARAFGHTVVVTGGYRGKGIAPDGKPFEDHLRWTDTWVRMHDGRWQCVASHYTAIS
ncbi:MAG: nuclear transport factor 2 family protein [Proteobacteria bacterium]|nr:nuclear transport factor 2 family protein [Pseudomonadota bacterium]